MHKDDQVEVIIDLRPEPWVGIVKKVEGQARAPLALVLATF